MSKTEADDVLGIDINFMRQRGYLDGIRSGTLTWTFGISENKSSISFTANTVFELPYLELNYTQTDRESNKKESFKYKVSLTSTPCHFGGKRWWFVCPLKNNGVACERRVGKLYKDGNYFGCRHCYNLTYHSQNENRRYRWHSLLSVLDAEKKMEELHSSIKRRMYAGKPTKKQAKLYKLYEVISVEYNKINLNTLR